MSVKGISAGFFEYVRRSWLSPSAGVGRIWRVGQGRSGGASRGESRRADAARRRSNRANSGVSAVDSVTAAGSTCLRRVGESTASHRGRLNTLTILGLAAALAGGCASAPSPPSKPLDACAIFKERPSWYKATKKAERKWGTPVAVQLAIIQAESSFRHDARPPGRVSSAYGYSQAIDGTWDWYREQTGHRRAKRTKFDHAVDFVGWYTDVSHRTLGISKWDGYSQYLAYHEGHRGFQRGTYRKKDWLVRVARRVDQQAKTYGAQLRSCRR